MNCVVYNSTSLQFINTTGGNNVFVDLVSGTLSAIGLEATTYPGGNKAWWRLLQYYGTVKSYSQYGANASQIRLKTIDDSTQTNTDLVGWIDYDPVDQNILYWISDSQSFPNETMPPITAIVNPQVSGPNINLPAASVGQSYLLTESLPIRSASWGNFSFPLSNASTTQPAVWTAGTTYIDLNEINPLIKTGQLVISETPGIPIGSIVLKIDEKHVQIVNENTPLSSNITVSIPPMHLLIFIILPQ